MSRPAALKPIFSEKAFRLSKSGVYMFEIPATLGKLEVGAIVESQFKVEVGGVRVANLRGEARRVWRKRGGWQAGRKADKKRAYVQLKPGNNLPFFEDESSHEPDHSEKPAKTPAKETK